MDPAYQRSIRQARCEAILREFQTQQHLHPHRTVSRMLILGADSAGFCVEAGERAMESLGLPRDLKIGRLRRTELIQMARITHRLSRPHASAGQVNAG